MRRHLIDAVAEGSAEAPHHDCRGLRSREGDVCPIPAEKEVNSPRAVVVLKISDPGVFSRCGVSEHLAELSSKALHTRFPESFRGGELQVDKLSSESLKGFGGSIHRVGLPRV
jgi:hypothetical protein